MNDLIEKLNKSKDISGHISSQLEIVMETLTQIRVKNEVNLLPSILDIIMKISKMSESSDLNIFYLIEICVQLCI